MKPTMKIANNLNNRLQDSMTATEEELFLDCAWQMVGNLETKIKKSRNLTEISGLKQHVLVVQTMIQNFNQEQLKVS